ncbi:MAG: 6-carboxytetrahydropterin synthase QueD [Myxococcales bacterium]|jgi:6-pyruvoyltetrahydropterin/6-carboxytetrahydropterin synthase|nr:6-carboxytetrahydropterin synthase QueD [Myxococcales bacterium]
MDLDVEFDFCCAHDLPNYEGICRRLHGHHYRMLISITGRPDAHTGMIMDFEDLRQIVTERVLDLVDHRYLNEIPGLENPTAENMIVLFWNRLKESLPGLREIRLWETPAYSVTYRGD